jgi:hypothetical protein
MARLAASWDGPLVELPKLPLPSGPQLVSQLVRCLDRGLEGLEEG